MIRWTSRLIKGAITHFNWQIPDLYSYISVKNEFMRLPLAMEIIFVINCSKRSYICGNKNFEVINFVLLLTYLTFYLCERLKFVITTEVQITNATWRYRVACYYTLKMELIIEKLIKLKIVDATKLYCWGLWTFINY